MRPMLHPGRIMLFSFFEYIIVSMRGHTGIAVTHRGIGFVGRSLAALDCDSPHLVVRDHIDVSNAMPLSIVFDHGPVGFILPMIAVGEKHRSILGRTARRINHLRLPSWYPGLFPDWLEEREDLRNRPFQMNRAAPRNGSSDKWRFVFR